MGSISSLSLLLGFSSKVPPFESLESFTSQVSGAFWRVPPTSRRYWFPSLGIISFPSLKTRSGSPLLPTPPLPEGVALLLLLLGMVVWATHVWMCDAVSNKMEVDKWQCSMELISVPSQTREMNLFCFLIFAFLKSDCLFPLVTRN